MRSSLALLVQVAYPRDFLPTSTIRLKQL